MVASSTGAALRTGKPTLLLVGDVSFAHDLSSLAIARTVRSPLCIFISDNAGGGIFEHLPAADQFRNSGDWTYWTTPPKIDFQAIAKGFGVTYQTVSSTETAAALVSRSLQTPGVTLISARTDAESSLSFLRAMGPGPRPPGGFN
jgi:2-succinyl-5-enolpyruvyl-6-hydroxy-3-cyclohexene-1-carboxylate synthase